MVRRWGEAGQSTEEGRNELWKNPSRRACWSDYASGKKSRNKTAAARLPGASHPHLCGVCVELCGRGRVAGVHPSSKHLKRLTRRLASRRGSLRTGRGSPEAPL